eukprot:1156746-Pelagomonas_calceolata.AAC.2
MGVQSSRAFKIVFVVITVKQCSKKHELHQHDVNPLRFESQKANGHVYKAHGQQHAQCLMQSGATMGAIRRSALCNQV